jgi:beta-lactam-binding protein with PASTA domain
VAAPVRTEKSTTNRRPRPTLPHLPLPRTPAVEIVDPSPPGWRLPVALGVVILLLVLAVWGWVDELQTHAVNDDLPRIDLPSVAGSDQASAQAQLEALGFVVSIKTRPNETVPAGTVFGEDPVAGAKVEQGDLVSVLVSSGQAGVSVPSMVGEQVADAQALLASDGLTATVTQVYDEVVRPGEVMASAPKAGGHVPQAGSVALTVSNGPAPRTVPALVGTDLNSSLVSLGRSGLGIGTITRTYKAGQPEGLVLSIDPAAGAQVPREMPVKLTVTGPPPTSTVPSMTGLLQASAESLAKTAGVHLDEVTKPVPTGNPTAGRVVAQGVPPYAEVPSGSNVQITIAVVDPTLPPGG